MLRNVAMNSSRVGSGDGERADELRECVDDDERRYMLGLERPVSVDGVGDTVRWGNRDDPCRARPLGDETERGV
jgi:hypothetical protein